MTTLEITLTIILYVILALLSYKPIKFLLEPDNPSDRLYVLFLTSIFPVFWFINSVLVLIEGYGDLFSKEDEDEE